MPREKHPIHLVAKKADQLNKVMLAIMKEERPSHDARRLISVFRQDLAKAASQPNRLASRVLCWICTVRQKQKLKPGLIDPIERS